MVLSMRDVFKHIQRETDKNWIVTCGYLEVYNEELFDLLTPSSKPLDLREDPELGPTIAGLRRIEVKTPEKIFSLLKEGNR
jgi:kinesin family protein 18/19